MAIWLWFFLPAASNKRGAAFPARGIDSCTLLASFDLAMNISESKRLLNKNREKQKSAQRFYDFETFYLVCVSFLIGWDASNEILCPQQLQGRFPFPCSDKFCTIQNISINSP